jgi:Ca2+-binding EF-hand superfamily protein
MVRAEQGSAKYGVMGDHGKNSRRFSLNSDFLSDICAQDRAAIRRTKLEEVRRKRELRDRVQALDTTGDLKKIFKEMDEDRDGTITLNELMGGLLNHGVTMSEVDIQFLHERMDADGDGQVSMKEFKAFMREDLSNKTVEKWMREISSESQKELLRNVDMNRKQGAVKENDDRNRRIRELTKTARSPVSEVNPLVENDVGVSKEWRADDWTEIRQRLLAKRKKFGLGQNLAFFLALKKAGQSTKGGAYMVEHDNEPTSMTFDNFRRSLAVCGMKGEKCREAIDPLMEELDKTGMGRVYMDTLLQFLDGNRRQIASPFHRRLAGLRGFNSNSPGNEGGGGSLHKTQGKYGLMGDKRKHYVGARMERFDDKYSMMGQITDVLADRSECRRVQLREMAHMRRLRAQIAEMNESGAMREMFECMDRSGDGSVDVKELAQGLKEAGVHMSPTELHYVFINYDADGDGGITWAEFDAFMQKDLSNVAVQHYMDTLQESERITTLNTHTDYRSAKYCKEDDAKLARTVVKLGEGGSEADVRAAVRARLVEKRMQLGGGGLFFTTLKRMGHSEADPQRAIEALKFDPYPRSIPFAHFKRALAAWGVQLEAQSLVPLMMDLSLDERWLERVSQQKLLNFIAGKTIKKTIRIRDGKPVKQTPAESARDKRVARNTANASARGLQVPSSDSADGYTAKWMDDSEAAQWVSRDGEQAMAALRQQAEDAVREALLAGSVDPQSDDSLRYGGAGGMELVDKIMQEQQEQHMYPAMEAETEAAVRIQSTIRRNQSQTEVKEIKRKITERDWREKQRAATLAEEQKQSVRSRVLRGLLHQRELCKHYMQPLSAARAAAAVETTINGDADDVDVLFFDSLRLLGASTGDSDRTASTPLVDRTVPGKLLGGDGALVKDLGGELSAHGTQRGVAEGEKPVQLKDASITFKLFRKALQEWGLPHAQAIDPLLAELDVLGTMTVCRRPLIQLMASHQDELVAAEFTIQAAANVPKPEPARQTKRVRKGGGAWVDENEVTTKKPFARQRDRLGSFMREMSYPLAEKQLEQTSKQRNHTLANTGRRNQSDFLRLHSRGGGGKRKGKGEGPRGKDSNRAAFLDSGGSGAELLLHLGRSEEFVEGQLVFEMAMDYASHCETQGERMSTSGGSAVRHRPLKSGSKSEGSRATSPCRSKSAEKKFMNHRPWYISGANEIPSLDESLTKARYLDLTKDLGMEKTSSKTNNNLDDSQEEAHAILAAASDAAASDAAAGSGKGRRTGSSLFGLKGKRKPKKKRRVKRAKAVVPVATGETFAETTVNSSAGVGGSGLNLNSSMDTSIGADTTGDQTLNESTDADLSVIASALGLAMGNDGSINSANSACRTEGGNIASAPMLSSLQAENGKLKAMVQCLAENLKLRVSVNQLTSALETQQLPGHEQQENVMKEEEDAHTEYGAGDDNVPYSMPSDSQTNAKSQLLVSISEALNSINESEMLMSSVAPPPRNDADYRPHNDADYRPHTAPSASAPDASASYVCSSPQAKVLSFASSPQTPQPQFQSLRALSPKVGRRPKSQQKGRVGKGNRRPVSHSR